MRAWLWIVVLCTVCLFTAAARGQTINTEGQISKLIVVHPIEAKAEEVKKLLGEPLSKSPDFYKLEEFNVLVSYEGGSPCDPDCVKNRRYCGWNVPRDTIVTLAIIVKVAFHQDDLKKLGIDLTTYERMENSDHIPDTIQYSNDEQGIRIIINGNQVESIALFPAKKYLHFMCLQPKETAHCSNKAGKSSAP